MKVFLTGGTGFIGQRLVGEMLEQDWQVTALVRNLDTWQARYIGRMGAHCIPGDITERESMRVGMAGADIVINLGGVYKYGLNAIERRQMTAANVTGVENMLSLATELGIPRTIHVSTVLAYGDSGHHLRDETFERQVPYRTWYEKTKTEGHVIARQYQQHGLPLIIACPNGVVGVNDSSFISYFLRLYLNKIMPPFCWSPECVIAPVDVDDLTRGIFLAAEKGLDGETYFFSGESNSLREQLSIWHMCPGGTKKLIWLPSSMMAAMLWPLEPFQKMAGLPAFMSRETVKAVSTNVNYSSEKARRELGWKHRTAQQMWSRTIDGEMELLAKRNKRDLASLLNPVELEY